MPTLGLFGGAAPRLPQRIREQPLRYSELPVVEEEIVVPRGVRRGVGMFGQQMAPPSPGAQIESPAQQPAQVPPLGMMMRGPEKPKPKGGGVAEMFGYKGDDAGMGALEWWFSTPGRRDKAAAEVKAQSATEMARAEMNRQIQTLQQQGYRPDQIVAFLNNPEKFAENIAEGLKPQTSTFFDPRTGQWSQKPQDLMSVGEGTDVFDPNKRESVYTNTPTPKPPEPFTLNPGDVRFDANGNQVASVAPRPETVGGRWRAATPSELAQYGMAPDSGGQINEVTGEFKMVGDSRKAGAVPASIQLAEQKYLDAQDAEASRLVDLFSKYSRFNELAKDWNSQGEGIFNDIGQAMSMETSQLKAITSELIGKMRSPGEGVMTDADAKRLENATVGINQTREGNQMAEAVVKAAAERAQMRAMFIRQWVADNGAGSSNKAKLAWANYAKAFPVYDAGGLPVENAPEPYSWAAQNGFLNQAPQRAQGAPPQAAPVRVNSPQERDALPPGTQYIAPDGSVKIKR